MVEAVTYLESYCNSTASNEDICYPTQTASTGIVYNGGSRRSYADIELEFVDEGDGDVEDEGSPHTRNLLQTIGTGNGYGTGYGGTTPTSAPTTTPTSAPTPAPVAVNCDSTGVDSYYSEYLLYDNDAEVGYRQIMTSGCPGHATAAMNGQSPTHQSSSNIKIPLFPMLYGSDTSLEEESGSIGD